MRAAGLTKEEVMNAEAKPILVVGGGISGMTAAVEAAEFGCDVILVEKEAYLGGRVLRMHRYFPKMCPPSCGFEINIRRIRQNPRITVHTLGSVECISGTVGDFTARIKIGPRYVSKSIDDSISDRLESERADTFNYGMGTTKALYLPHDMSYPPLPVLDPEALTEADAAVLKDLVPPEVIDQEMKEQVIEARVGAVIIATGWKPYDAENLTNLGFGDCENVVTNVVMERLASRRGPTGGEILRPSDGKPPDTVAFVQCAGSRDEDHLPYCSAVCCTASLKQARYLREANPEAKATVFYIDIRTIGRLEKFYYDMLDDPNISFVKGKVSGIREEADSQDLILEVEDTISAEKPERSFSMVVLATGMVPNSVDFGLPFEVEHDQYGFLDGTTDVEGVYTAGCVRHPCDVSRATKESTAAALRAVQCLT
jgi:quinone-modifying oxidoreductase subunit QmoA